MIIKQFEIDKAQDFLNNFGIDQVPAFQFILYCKTHKIGFRKAAVRLAETYNETQTEVQNEYSGQAVSNPIAPDESGTETVGFSQ